MAIGVAGVASSAYLAVSRQLHKQVDDTLSVNYLRPLFGLIGAPGSQGRLRGVRQIYAAAEVLPQGGALRPLSDLFPGQVRTDARLQAVADGDAPSARYTATLVDGTHARVVAYPAVEPTTGQQVGALVVARSLSETDASLSRLRVELLLAGGLGVLLAAVGGLLVARAGLRPVDRLTAAAEEVARTQQLDRPIEVRGDDEVARLARSFNAMTAALLASRERQRQLVADAGHELRTPLTSLRTNLDLLQRSESSGRPLPPEDRVRLLADLRAQVAELGQLVGELVDLARDEPPVEPVQRVDLADVVARAVDRARPRAGELVRLVVDLQPWVLHGQPGALERAVLNLVDNAVKFSPPGGAVEVLLHPDDGVGVLEVLDRGPGVAEEDRPHVFERFFRATSARGLPGSGLGLSIVAQTVEQHGGRVSLDPRPGGGTVARVALPGASGPAVPPDELLVEEDLAPAAERVSR